MKLTPKSTISRSTKLAARLFEGEMLVITAHDSKLHRLNEVGTFIWQQLEEPKSAEQICRSVEEHFDQFDKKKNDREIIAFLNDLREKQLITVSNSNE